jgi:XTP/dITP diphosphohydrolase
MEIILATWNKTKIDWLTKGFSNIGLKIRPLYENEINDVEENGNTSAENALIKVRAVGTINDSIIIGEDSILSVEALNGFPGVKTIRWSNGTDDDRSLKLLEKLRDIPENKRGAKFQSSVAVLFPDGSEETFIGELNGKISNKLIGEEGKGYQRLFILPDGKSIAQSGSSLVKSGDHRDQSMRRASLIIQKWLRENDK